VNSSPPPTPSISATGPGTINDFDVSAPSYSGGYWTWSVAPKSSAPSGVYNFVATLGTLTPATSDPFRVVQYICPPSGGPSCDGTSNLTTRAPGKLKIANTLGTSILLDFQLGLDPVPLGCNNDPNDPNDSNDPTHTWNRTYYLDANQNKVYFPAVALDFTEREGDLLQVTYAIRNSDWILTNAARGNNDIEFCAVARHQTARWNGDGAEPRPFSGKYGPAQWDGTDYSFVLTTVSNPSKVKTDGTGSPAVCGRGTQDISGETWRTWLVCIPFDVDYKMG
jgi:hypothetical protein